MTDLSRLVAPGADAMFVLASEALLRSSQPAADLGAVYAEVLVVVAEEYGLDEPAKDELHHFVSAGIAALHALFERLAAHQVAIASATAERAGAAVQ